MWFLCVVNDKGEIIYFRGVSGRNSSGSKSQNWLERCHVVLWLPIFGIESRSKQCCTDEIWAKFYYYRRLRSSSSGSWCSSSSSSNSSGKICLIILWLSYDVLHLAVSWADHGPELLGLVCPFHFLAWSISVTWFFKFFNRPGSFYCWSSSAWPTSLTLYYLDVHYSFFRSKRSRLDCWMN